MSGATILDLATRCALRLLSIAEQVPTTGQGPPTAETQSRMPPAPLPPDQWSLLSWVGVLIYIILFLLAAWWIYRLADLGGPNPKAPGATETSSSTADKTF